MLVACGIIGHGRYGAVCYIAIVCAEMLILLVTLYIVVINNYLQYSKMALHIDAEYKWIVCYEIPNL